MSMKAVELKVFLPSQDFALSKHFYQDLGFHLAWSDADLAYLSHGAVAFLLQNDYVKAFAENLQMHLLVEDVDRWWAVAQSVAAKYQVRAQPPQDQPWGIRDFVLLDPCGVCWRIGENLPRG